MEKDAANYVRHILEAITNIETDTAGYDFEKFRADRRSHCRHKKRRVILSSVLSAVITTMSRILCGRSMDTHRSNSGGK